ncbi:zinc-dependent alcohol dehydrogenase family protein [Roseateles oligotrophus]|uniref:NAD(P)-dependent alcohol dehydrogenase n=1 Tax=Roseateles oligotrophus TaxID=1769250 RepID=A0ABT2YH30_9BURK|nr:NAD(P)-dependent alcohol dehydrogenase [Roseateles oligotrophus]MCV2369353.1 NAD(P)-dependent alcohol dehydrogenase [Roseateles oligotrophus]
MTSSSRQFQLLNSGSALVLELKSVQIPTPSAGQVLLRMGAASLNYRDLLTQGDSASTKDGLVPLSDGAGTVIALGAGVARWKLGDRVMANFFPGWVDGAFNPTQLGNAFGGGTTDGMLAEHVIVDQSSLVAVPEGMSLEEASTLPCAALTAWHALFERGGIKAGDTVLVQGTGGVALFGLQLATAIGAKVIVTSSSDAKLARVKAMGAWQTINYRSHPDWEKVALDLTGGRGVDHILELGGPDTYDRSIAAIAPGGKIAQIGVLTGFASQPNILPLQFKNASINGICVGSVEQLKRLVQFMAQHQIRPVIDEQFAFESAPEAYAQLSAATHFGKLVVKIA